MRLEITHRTTYRYDAPASGLGVRLRLYPTRLEGQRVESWHVTIEDTPIAPLLVNGFGDAEGQWICHGAREALAITAEGVVETEDRSGVVGKAGRARAGVFLRRTELTAPDEAIAAFAEGLRGRVPLDTLHALKSAIPQAVTYRSGSTHHGVTAAEALERGAGVCQDMAHLFIAAARHLGIPARYVVGYLHDPDSPIGETHAWAEAFVEGLGWIGFDPTHDQCPTDAYVRLCSGLDAVDAAPIRGTFIQGPEEELAVEVAIADTQSQQQQQSQG